MPKSEKPNALIVEELLAEFEQQLDIDEENENETYAQYAWEKDFDKSWEQLVDRDGVLQFVQSRTHDSNRSTTELDHTVDEKNDLIQKRGIIRNMIMIFDISDRMREMDFKPDRLYCAFGAVKEFIRELFHQGPITQLALIGLRDKQSIMISQLGTNPTEKIELLGDALKEGASGMASLQNGLEMSLSMLSDLPPCTTREILVIFGSTRTFDAGNILVTLKKLKDAHICVNAISLAPEMYILKHICDKTGGRYAVAIDSVNLRNLLTDHTIPPKWCSWMEPILTKVGFPPFEKANIASLCVCHSKLTYKAYICPQCHSKSCSIPTKCKCCGLYLISPPDISRTFHHIIPPKPFLEDKSPNVCSGCHYAAQTGSRCPDCKSFLCEFCNEYIHIELHQCPMCMVRGVVKTEHESR